VDAQQVFVIQLWDWSAWSRPRFNYKDELAQFSGLVFVVRSPSARQWLQHKLIPRL
jgi:hypothetical protein